MGVRLLSRVTNAPALPFKVPSSQRHGKESDEEGRQGRRGRGPQGDEGKEGKEGVELSARTMWPLGFMWIVSIPYRLYSNMRLHSEELYMDAKQCGGRD